MLEANREQGLRGVWLSSYYWCCQLGQLQRFPAKGIMVFRIPLPAWPVALCHLSVQQAAISTSPFFSRFYSSLMCHCLIRSPYQPGLLSGVFYVKPFVLFCRSATTKRTVTVRLTGPPPSVTSQALVAAWTVGPSDRQVSGNSGSTWIFLTEPLLNTPLVNLWKNYFSTFLILHDFIIPCQFFPRVLEH